MKIKISLIIPILNEADAIPLLIEKTSVVMAQNFKNNFEVILVNDGSTDNSEEAIAKHEKNFSWLRYISLSRNYGQSTALQAGFDFSRGELIVTMDGDLQNDPEDIPNMIKILDKNSDIDVISGWRKDRKDFTLSRKLPSKIANKIISSVTGTKLNDYGCSLKVYRSEIIKNLRLYGEMHRFIPAIAADVGAKIVELPVRHYKRETGKSKYGIDRTVRVLLDLIWIKFSHKFILRPIHAFGGIALLMLVLGILIFLFLLFEKLVLGNDIGGRPLMVLGLLLTLIGTQFLAVGLIGEILTRIYHEPLGRKQYLIRKKNFSSEV
uniref:Glycosyltransferases involved in cell wall biogenesis n=1 Tax=uncultured beta proteobacterium HF0130_04F21 TaxID=710819 RepID=E0XST8_9PROT|nr:glycosyltransferases involved in cell wall biogenesis [uncultured beta proteobacterium HF0130_04F21]